MMIRAATQAAARNTNTPTTRACLPRDTFEPVNAAPLVPAGDAFGLVRWSARKPMLQK